VGTARLRAGPGRVYPVLASLLEGAEALILGKTAAGDWLKLSVAEGQEGWLPLENLAMTGQADALLVITDIPPTPTFPPPTAAPPPTPTPAPFLWRCLVTVMPSQRAHHLIAVGEDWPPNALIEILADDTRPGAVRGYNPVMALAAGGPESDRPNGFWVELHYESRMVFWFRTTGCESLMGSFP
jgi:hypothetical protein